MEEKVGWEEGKRRSVESIGRKEKGREDRGRVKGREKKKEGKGAHEF